MPYRLTKLFLVILVTYVSPVFLILTGLVPFEYRFYVLKVATILIVLYSLSTSIGLSKLGFSKKNLWPSIKHILPITLIFALPIIFALILGWTRIDNSKISWSFYLFFIFISSPSQEILYRGYLFHLLGKAGLNKSRLVILSSILYSFVHLIYLDIATLIITFIIGIFWGINYQEYRNIYGVILSHSILGAMAILAGMV